MGMLISHSETRILRVGCENPSTQKNKPSVWARPKFCCIKYFWKLVDWSLTDLDIFIVLLYKAFCWKSIFCQSVSQFTRSVVSDSLWSHGLQHARLPCPSPTPGIYSNSRPLSQWCNPTISSSVVPFSFCLQSFPAAGSFQMSQFLASGGQSIGVSASASVLPTNTQDWSPLGWTGWILQSEGLPRVFSKTTVQTHPFFSAQLFL